jgi:hypothetical protein
MYQKVDSQRAMIAKRITVFPLGVFVHKHGGIFDVGNCMSFNMTMYDPSVVFGG